MTSFVGTLDGLARWGRQFEDATGLPASGLAALLVLLAGWLVALALRSLARRLVRRLGGLLPGHARDTVLGDVVGAHDTGAVVGRVVFWLVIVLALMAATEVLGLPVVTGWLSQVASYLPQVLGAVLVVVIGVVIGRLARSGMARTLPATAPIGAQRLGRLVEFAIVAAAGLVAVEQLGVAITFLTTLVHLVLGAALAGAALAFGLGGRDFVAHILAAHYVRQIFEVGERVRVEDVEGRIVRITQTAVILQAEEGEVVVPASVFAATRTVRLAQES